ncbi:DUF4012 domain-containing protein [Microbacterium karelineae]|uniref:DUF4012 domain-containing protein n=1 Tax=Microbacterium karelineae TaxID=2654283 RepID=UPI0012EA19C0|nr:DUF4012 domain-containing protein [Microbacterium karelineae]
MTDENDPFAGLTRKQLRDMRARLDAAEAARAGDEGDDASTTALPAQGGSDAHGAETTVLPGQGGDERGRDATAPPETETTLLPTHGADSTQAAPAADAPADMTGTPAQGAETTMLPAQGTGTSESNAAAAGAAPGTPIAQADDAPTPALGTPAVAPGAAGGSGGADGGAPSGDVEGSGRRWTKRHTKRTIIIAVIVLIVCAVWLGVRALMVKGDLEAAQRVVAHVQQDPDSLDASLPVLGEYAGSAASVGWDPIWRVAEFLPWAGDNLRGVRLAAQSLDVGVNDLAVPALDAMRSESETPVLQRLLPILDEVQPDITSLADGIHGVAGSGALIGPVRNGVDMVDGVMQAAAPAIGVAPGLLGADEPRNYLLVFMNNAESVGLGGSAASQTLISVDQGKLEIAAQASSASYVEGQPVDVEVADSAIQLYTDYLRTHVNTTASRPDFPTMSELTTAFWNRDIGDQQIDGVVSIDPIALGYILEATGPIQLDTGETLSSTNAAQLLLSDVYSMYDSTTDPAAADAFFASVAGKVFEKIATADFDMPTMLNSMRRGIDQGSVLFHSFDDETQAFIADERVSGILPTSNEEQSTVGVYFRDESASKIDYYMKSNIDLTQTCSAGGSEFQVDTTLHLDIDQASADVLPLYVQSNTSGWGSTRFRTAVYVYGPPGTTVESVEMEGREVELKSDEIDDLGRPVAFFWTYLAPTELAKVTATFSGEGDFGPAALWSTPMVNATTGTVTACGE